MGIAAATEVSPQAAARNAVCDMAFGVLGNPLPPAYRCALRDAITEELGWFAGEAAAAIHPLRATPVVGGALLLSARSRLILRIPANRGAQTAELSGRVLQVGSARVRVGLATSRPLLAHGTVYAHLVTGDVDDEAGFTASIRRELEALGIRAEVICGRRQALDAGDALLRGFGVMVHGLSSEASVRLQERGIGRDMQLGCGIFVPHRSAAAVGS